MLWFLFSGLAALLFYTEFGQLLSCHYDVAHIGVVEIIYLCTEKGHKHVFVRLGSSMMISLRLFLDPYVCALFSCSMVVCVCVTIRVPFEIGQMFNVHGECEGCDCQRPPHLHVEFLRLICNRQHRDSEQCACFAQWCSFLDFTT